ncbi:TPA: sugar phosphate isomerase/epimerase [Citrobacter freundii]|uniref:sugar phosphate isomerase/epimerase family protein n=2 Tax=Citrobacter freundii TaxID=546 RepID=UPI0017855B29|nr:TIM barrel protein [Citrobacter freundii]EKX5049654.1 sugar phosphate isomerase/epimerase [Citrobacter freundii]MBE0004255.1 sugar phosphate isomerase/epimerase [Citrobacter freundii]HAT3688098.1 sugar phosphate isomerase/epimerase [Citrobacter freundii]HAT3768617.1 sugar phosphate isomerase/epimerase [Citrobacter freundii]
MRISLSGMAWNTTDDDAICHLLHASQVDAIDVVPGKYFPNPLCVSDREIAAVRQYWQQNGISLVGMQSLLFGTQGLNLFAANEVQQKMLDHLQAISRIAAGLGIPTLVFGSPKNRDRQGLNDDVTLEIATTFFHRLGNIAQQEGVIFCLEPNPSCYGANFMINSAETAFVVRQVNHPAIKMQLDTGAITINQENIHDILQRDADIIGHIHLSEPNLVPLGRGSANHVGISNALNSVLPHLIATIEMLETKSESSLVAIEEALNFVTRNYRHSAGEVV